MNKKNGGGWTPLMYASYIGHDTIVHLLLEAGVSVNVPTPEGQFQETSHEGKRGGVLCVGLTG